MNKLHALNLGYTGAIITALIMLLLGILGNLGVYTRAVTQMSEWHIFFSLSFGGIIGGMIEAAVISFVLFYAFALIYNWLLKGKGEHE